MKQIVQLHKKKSLKIIGLMSGTSCDGVDLALTEITGAGRMTDFKVLQTQHYPYSAQQKKALFQILEPGHADLKTTSQVNFYLASLWASAIKKLLKKAALGAGEIDLIGSHGHTLYHLPVPETFIDRKISSTFQAGDPAVLAHLTGITTIGDFRVADVGLGGQGAPLVPYVDWMIFGRLKKNLLVLNIGGIANFTFIPKNGKKDDVQAFDTGPGNMLIDQLMQRLYQKPYDRNGAIAARGRFSEKLFTYLQKIDDYPTLSPPKSTGREQYGKPFIILLLKKALRWRIPEPDILHTVSVYTTHTIHQASEKFIGKRISALYVSGGGGQNRFLMKSLAEKFKGTEIKKSAEVGLDEDFKEAICFAILASELIRGNSANLWKVTGAKQSALLGKICPVVDAGNSTMMIR